MVPKEKLWILTAQCPSRLGTVDVVTRSLAETRNYVVAIESLTTGPPRALASGGNAPLDGEESLTGFGSCSNRAPRNSTCNGS